MRGLGVDILEVARMAKALERQGPALAARILCPDELQAWQQSKRPERFLAKRFAAKEAIAKALGTGIAKGVGFQQMAVEHDALGAPQVRLQGAALARLQHLGASHCWLSLSDEQHYVVAMAVIS